MVRVSQSERMWRQRSEGEVNNKVREDIMKLGILGVLN